MKRIRGVVAVLALSVVLVAPRQAEAQVQLGWNSSLAVVCLNLACTNVQFTLSLSGLKPTDNGGQPVPPAILALNSPGYPTFFTLDIFSGPGIFSSAAVVSPGSWTLTSITNGGFTAVNTQNTSPYGSAPVVVNATLSAGGIYAFGWSGLAYLGPNGECYNSAGGIVSRPSPCTATDYRQGDFNGLLQQTAVPEPMSMTLLGTGLLGLGLVGVRRRKNAKK